MITLWGGRGGNHELRGAGCESIFASGIQIIGCFSTYASMRSLLKGASIEDEAHQSFDGFTLIVGVTLGVLGSRMSNAQEEKDNLKGGKILQRNELKGAPGWEAILVDRTLPAGAESGKHTQAGNEIVYVETGSVTFEAQGKTVKTLKPNEAFTTVDGEVRNVKNASKTEPAKALAFYVA
jgi:quercetin dioxygenase-like cupin family protein